MSTSIPNVPCASFAGETVSIRMSRTRLDALARAALNRAGALALLVLLSPVFLLVALAIRLDSKGPVFFVQKRGGLNGRAIDVFKFRSMYVQAPDAAATVRQARRGDPRVTRIGAFLRRTSLDELPQLLNVFNGTMALVGPRPHALSHDAHYGALIVNYGGRHAVKPGLTGWAQVNGLRGETETLDKMQARVDHDIWYVRHQSFALDLRILARSAHFVLGDQAAY
ncbi:sugar transferase [Marinivivus vitaminiproducens]|uniref:sugar transferase n=1 Tax=Marinivivus vitaminiproducens TaxID=3035935 RepID=UPI00279B9A9A|nr:sugar transferase [Geminicoccaceae bacterium SCSIO 64248]